MEQNFSLADNKANAIFLSVAAAKKTDRATAPKVIISFSNFLPPEFHQNSQKIRLVLTLVRARYF